MPKYVITKGHDAFIYYEKVFEADTHEQALELADADRYGEGWVAAGHMAEYDDAEVDRDQEVCLMVDEKLEPRQAYWLTEAERNIVMAALRHWQDSTDIPPMLYDIAADHDQERGRFLSDNDIDVLIEENLNA